MTFKIPALEGYFGDKGASGVHQKIINLIPPHHTFVVPFLGHCFITRSLKPCSNWYLNDIDPMVVAEWQRYYLHNKDRFAKNTTFLKWSFEHTLPATMDHQEVVIYCDPTYPKETRKSDHSYPFEMQFAQHVHLLEKLNGFKNANILVSTYDNALYQFYLDGWNKIQFPSKTRGGGNGDRNPLLQFR